MTPRTPEPLLVDLAYLLLPTLWIGLLAGVCFIATPAKFQASSLSLPVALDVGRATFAVWNNVEWALLALMVPVLLFSRRLNPALAVGMIAILLLVQSVFLLPALNARIATIIAGGRLEPSPDHLMYIAIDGLKLGLLAAVIWMEGVRIMPSIP